MLGAMAMILNFSRPESRQRNPK